MANGKCETARLAFLFASPRHFDFLDCETETSKCSERERETFIFLAMRRLVSDRPARTPRVVLAVASHDSLRVRCLI